MEVKEAIECIKNRYDDVWLEGNCRIGQKELWRERDKVISLLQQGEAYKVENVELKAYKQMWGWLDNIINSYYGTEYQREFTTQQIREHMGELEQKYLKEAKQDEADNR